jgi:hypothetical protein
MNKNAKLSPSTVVFNAFPDAFRNFPSSIARVNGIVHPEGDTRGPRIRRVLEIIAQRMNDEKRRYDEHFNQVQQRAAASKKNSEDASDSDGLEDMFGGIQIETEIIIEASQLSSTIRSNNLSFIRVDDDSVVRTHIYPRTFHCSHCGHFECFNPAQPPETLQCSHCREEKLVQEPIVFMCARCANLLELAPPGGKRENSQYRKIQKTDDFLGRAPSCPDCQTGHIHLEKHNSNSIGIWEWICTNNQCSYHEQVRYSCLECYLPAVKNELEPENNLTAQVISMNAFPAAASSALKGLFDTQMFIHDDLLDPSSLSATAQQVSGNWNDYFDLNSEVGSELDKEAVNRIHESCIENAYLLDRIGIVKTVYGYKAGNIASHAQTPIAEVDGLSRFFRDSEGFSEYVCYGMINDGAALVIELNKQMIIDRLSEIVPQLSRDDYDEILARELRQLQGLSMKDILDLGGNNFILYRSLHALEHAILSTSMLQIGNEVLGSTLFPREAILLIYEGESIGRGGVIQLVNKGVGLLSMVEAARDHVIGCAQGCVDGCPACIFVRDPHCSYNYAQLQRNWLPANSLLSRLGARRILVPNLPI